MSGYLARLAARAGGAPAAAGPRLPSRFEPNTDAPTDAEPPLTLARDLHSPERGAETHVDERAPSDTRARAVAVPPPVPSDPTPRGPGAEAAVPALPTNSPVRNGRTPEPEATAVAHRPATPALRVEAAPPPRAAERSATTAHRGEAAAAVTEPDVVHVTIERIEVRATVAAATPIARSAPQRRDSERSLHDYLAGRSR